MRFLIALTSLSILASALGAENAEPHPTLSGDGSWVPIMIIIIGAMFLAAVVIGPIVRANMPEEPPPDSHDEHHDDHSSAHQHGAHH